MTLAPRPVSRPVKSCPKCGGIARPAYYRGERPRGGHSPFVSISHAYCPACDRLVDP